MTSSIDLYSRVPRNPILGAAYVQRIIEEFRYSFEAGAELKKVIEVLLKDPAGPKALPSEHVSPHSRKTHRSLDNKVLDDSGRSLEAELENHGIQCMIRQPTKTPFLAKVDQFRDEKVRCIVNFNGSLLPVAFPKVIIEGHKLAIGDEFDWYPSRGRPVQFGDCRPIRHEPLSEKERKRLDAFVERGRSMEDILAE